MSYCQSYFFFQVICLFLQFMDKIMLAIWNCHSTVSICILNLVDDFELETSFLPLIIDFPTVIVFPYCFFSSPSPNFKQFTMIPSKKWAECETRPAHLSMPITFRLTPQCEACTWGKTEKKRGHFRGENGFFLTEKVDQLPTPPFLELPSPSLRSLT